MHPLWNKAIVEQLDLVEATRNKPIEAEIERPAQVSTSPKQLSVDASASSGRRSRDRMYEASRALPCTCRPATSPAGTTRSGAI